MKNQTGLSKYATQQMELAEISETASSILLVQNAGVAFEAVQVVNRLRAVLSDEIMKDVFMPLMNTKIGFLTDKNDEKQPSNRYSLAVVRDCIIDAFAIGVLPTFNQFNIIAGKMYPTKEGYTYLLKRIGAKYWLSFGHDISKDASFAEIVVTISFEYEGEKKSFQITAIVKKNQYSSYDQVKGKAERRAKKALYEYLTGLDHGEDDGDYASSEKPIDVKHEEITEKKKEIGKQQKIEMP